MYEWAMNIWNMSADEFQELLILVLVIFYVLYEGKQEINSNRAKRFNEK